MIVIDDDILVVPCGTGVPLARLSIDDFDDPSEPEITQEQIHITIIRMVPGNAPEEPVGCFVLHRFGPWRG